MIKNDIVFIKQYHFLSYYKRNDFKRQTAETRNIDGFEIASLSEVLPSREGKKGHAVTVST